MSRKAIYSVIGLLLISGVCLIGLAASILIRQPFSQPISLANTDTPTASETTLQITNTPTEIPILVFTATSPATIPPAAATSTVTSTITATSTQTVTKTPAPSSTHEITKTPPASATPTMTPATITQTPTRSLFTLTPEPSMTSAPPSAIGPICSKKGTTVYMVIGVGVSNQGKQFDAEVVRYALVNYTIGEVRIVSFHPDLIISGPLLKRVNINSITIRDFYNFVHNNVSSPDLQPDVVASNYLAQAIYEEFGMVPDHYFSVHSDAFVTMIDATRGIQIDIPGPYRDFQPGAQTLNGAQVLEYVRYPDPDLTDQINRQNRVILTLKDDLSMTSLYEAIPSLVNQYSKSFYTDLPLDELVKLRCVLRSVPAGNFTFFDIGPTYTTNEPGVGLQPEIDQIRHFLENLATFD